MLIIASFKFSPGLEKEMKIIQDALNSTKFMICEGYTELIESCILHDKDIRLKGSVRSVIRDVFMVIISFANFKNLRVNQADKVVFYNTHILNLLIGIAFKFRGVKIAQVLHEPNKYISERFKYGLIGFIKYSIIYLIHVLLVALVDEVYVMSQEGWVRYERSYSRYLYKLKRINLVVPQQSNREHSERKYISFIGHVNKAKGLEDFISLSIQMSETNHQFIIITSSNLTKYKSVLALSKNIKVINKPHITDEEIGAVIAESLFVVLFHKVATQSGVLALCSSYGTPVVARDLLAFREYMEVKMNSLILSYEFTPKEAQRCIIQNSNYSSWMLHSKAMSSLHDEYFSPAKIKDYYL